MTMPDSGTVGNVVSAPLMVISQIAEFLLLGQKAGNAVFSGFDNVQGFCIGFLTAAALAIFRDKDEFRRFASIANRLAVFIGSIVNLKERPLHDPLDRSSSMAVRWKMPSGREKFEDILRDYPSAQSIKGQNEGPLWYLFPGR